MKPATTTPSPVAYDRRWRLGNVGPFLLWIGGIFWLIGACLLLGSQTRGTTLNSQGTLNSSAITDGGLYTAGFILWILATIVWLISALALLMVAFAQTAVVAVEGQSGIRPGVVTLTLTAAWLQLFSTVLLLIGACVAVGGGLNNFSGGSVLLLIGFTLWGISLLMSWAVTFVVSTMVAVMPISSRHFSWGSTTAVLLVIIAEILFMVASIAFVVRDPSGLVLAGSIIFLIASVYFLFGTTMLMRTSSAFYGPILSFATAVPGATTTLGTTSGAKPSIPSAGATGRGGMTMRTPM